MEKPKTMTREANATRRMVVSIVIPTTSASRRFGGEVSVGESSEGVGSVCGFEAVGKKVKKRKTLL